MRPKRLQLFLIVLFLSIGSSGLRAQTVSLDKKNATLPEIFKSIYEQTDYYFYYDAEALAGANKVDIHVRQAPLQEVLQICFKNQPLDYSIKDKVITVREKTNAKTVSPNPDTQGIDVSGKILDEKGAPISAVSIQIRGTSLGTQSNDQGVFVLHKVPVGSILIFSHIGFETVEMRVTEKGIPSLVLRAAKRQLTDVSVSTGYQSVPKERATGSFDFVDNALINRSVSTNILDRIDGVTSGVLFNKNVSSSIAANQSSITIRGRSTIFSNPNPLIVVDNFPYDGDISTINPNDVESISVLKDAAAASIWGSFSGNGVIVITTKKGRYNQPLQLNFNASITLGEKPDLWYQPQISSGNFIDMQTYLYGKGYYNGILSKNYGYVSPAVGILSDRDNGKISPANADVEINLLRSQDVRNDISKYYFQQSVNQQYALNLQGGSLNHEYYFSVGLDENQPNMTENKFQRLTLNASNTFAFLNQKLEWMVDLSFQQINTTTDNSGYSSPYPYASLANDQGSASAVNQYRQSFIDTVGGGLLLDWNNRPLDQLRLADNTGKLTNYRINTNLKYKIQPGFDLNLLYQYSGGNSESENFQSQETYYTRNLINSLSQIDFSTNTVTRPVPLGGILDMGTGSYYGDDLRGQINFAHTWSDEHRLNVIAGSEIRSTTSESRGYRIYGYDQTLQTSVPVDNTEFYPHYFLPYNYAIIPNDITNLLKVNRFFSYFANASYSYQLKYTVSGSFRRDESNLFGVDANQKGVPLWSVGAAWEISREIFYHSSVIPYLRLRMTDGYNGNINNTISAYTTSSVRSFPNDYNASFQDIANPPNPLLRWERVHILNIALDFALKNKRVDGSVEYYLKNGEDLIGMSPVAPQTGFPQFTENSANMKGHGMDITINSVNIIHSQFSWTTNLLFSFTHDEISVYKVVPGGLYNYVNAGTLNPLVGHPLYSVYGYKSTGLDSAGNPQGIFAGKNSENYGGIENSTDFTSLQYFGPANPTYFGSLRNTFTFGYFSFSFNITYKFGYYFRRTSLDQADLLGVGNARAGVDFDKRWQNPGDERFTTVPSLTYPIDHARSDFYINSDKLIEKGDNIRLQDLQMSYDITKKQWKKFPGQSIRIYLYVRNIGILWRANKEGLDPDAVPTYSNAMVYPDPRAYSGGITIHF